MHVTRRVLSMNVDGYGRRGRPKKRWMDCVKRDMNAKKVNLKMMSNIDEWKKKTFCVDHT